VREGEKRERERERMGGERRDGEDFCLKKREVIE